MNIKEILFCLFFLFGGLTFAQQDSLVKPIYFEKAPQNLVRFYYDANYYLVDKNCEFKAIERLSEFVVSKNVFNGPFKDFAANGKVILTGNHVLGVKEGLFEAFHPNGQLKWRATFKNNAATGLWSYFYPDGKPFMTINYTDTAVLLQDFWDQKAVQRVTAGEGNYQFKMPFTTYNEYGYPFFERKGKVKKGKPVGYWPVKFVDDRGRSELANEEEYTAEGVFKKGFDLFTSQRYSVPYSIIPAESFLHAETLTFKSCNFDDYSGFLTYLTTKFSNMVKPTRQFGAFSTQFTYVVEINHEGTPEKAKLKKEFENTELNRVLEIIINKVPYYFPTLVEGQPAYDTLTVSMQLEVSENGQFIFHSAQIHREREVKQ